MLMCASAHVPAACTKVCVVVFVVVCDDEISRCLAFCWQQELFNREDADD